MKQVSNDLKNAGRIDGLSEYTIFFRLVQTLGSVGTTSQAYLRVPIGVGIGVVFLGESVSQTAWVGLTCVIAGVVAMTLPGRRQAALQKS